MDEMRKYTVDEVIKMGTEIASSRRLSTLRRRGKTEGLGGMIGGSETQNSYCESIGSFVSIAEMRFAVRKLKLV